MARARAVDADVLKSVHQELSGFVVANLTTQRFKKAMGVAIWLPGTKYTFEMYSKKYRDLSFHHDTRWGDALEYVLKDQ